MRLTPLVWFAIALHCTSAHAASGPTVRASIVMEADTGNVISAEGAHRLSAPASLAKLMTAYLALEALELGRHREHSKFVTSTLAARQPPSRLGLMAGEKIALGDALRALIVRSANDVAVVLAEGLGGSEAQFVAQMNRKAQKLGLGATRFKNASGLPARNQVTTPYDMAQLARALISRFPQASPILRSDEFVWKRRRLTRSHPLLRSEEVELLKTGFTCMAGYSLISMIHRKPRRLIAVVMGGVTPAHRDARVSAVVAKAFADPLARHTPEPNAKTALNRRMIAHSCLNPPSPKRFLTASGWSVELGLSLDPQVTVQKAAKLVREHKLRNARPWIVPELARTIAYRAGITGLTEANATDLCQRLRRTKEYCVVRAPAVGQAIAIRGKQALAHAKLRGFPTL